jgi:hypothetical protein
MSKSSITTPLELMNLQVLGSNNDTRERIQHQLQEVLGSSSSPVEAWHPYELATPQILFFAEEANPKT